MRPGTGDRPAAPCRTPLRPVLDTGPSRLVRLLRSGPPLRSTPPVRPRRRHDSSGPAPDSPPRRIHCFDPPLPTSCSPAPGRPSPPLNITATPTLPSPPPLPAPPRTLPAPYHKPHGQLPAGTLRFFRSFFVSLASPKILHLDIIKLSLVSALDFSYLWLR